MGNQYTVWHFRQDRNGGMGSFLCPPGHPNLIYRVERGPKSNPKDIMAVDTAASEEWVPADVRRRAKRLLETATLVESEGWVRHLYGYLRGCWTEDGQMWTNIARVRSQGGQRDLPAEYHAACVYARLYFPDHQPRLDLINADKGVKLYGAYLCVHCGKSVQYEARWDALAEFGRPPQCDKSADKAHSWEGGVWNG